MKPRGIGKKPSTTQGKPLASVGKHLTARLNAVKVQISGGAQKLVSNLAERERNTTGFSNVAARVASSVAQGVLHPKAGLSLGVIDWNDGFVTASQKLGRFVDGRIISNSGKSLDEVFVPDPNLVHRLADWSAGRNLPGCSWDDVNYRVSEAYRVKGERLTAEDVDFAVRGPELRAQFEAFAWGTGYVKPNDLAAMQATSLRKIDLTFDNRFGNDGHLKGLVHSALQDMRPPSRVLQHVLFFGRSIEEQQRLALALVRESFQGWGGRDAQLREVTNEKVAALGWKWIDFSQPKFARFIPDASGLHREISGADRRRIIQNVPVKMIDSAPGHKFLRDPRAVLDMANQMKWRNTGNLFDHQRPIQLGVFTHLDHGRVVVRSIEVTDGNHRLAAGLFAGKWRTIGDIPELYLNIKVNGVDVNGIKEPRWIPFEVAAQSSLHDWFEVSGWDVRDRSAQVDGSISGQNPALPAWAKSVSLDNVISETLRRMHSI